MLSKLLISVPHCNYCSLLSRGGWKNETDEEIVAHSISFLLAGYEMTANTLAYTSFLLALSPEIQEKLQATIDEYFEITR